MGDVGDMFNEHREHRKKLRAKYGRPCPKCRELLPKAHPSILLPGQTCRIHGYRDPRNHLTDEEYYDVSGEKP